jgi:hypothetical protein
MALSLGKVRNVEGSFPVPTYSPHSNVRNTEDKFKVLSSFLFVSIKFGRTSLYDSVTALWKEANSLK